MEENNSRTVPVFIPIIGMVLAISACIFGAYRGEVLTVFNKAANICMECIGLG